MRKLSLLIFAILTYASIEAQEYIDADTVKMTLFDTSDLNLGADYQTCSTSSSFPFYEADAILGHFRFQYSYYMDIPIFTINIDDDGGDLYKKLSLTIDSIQNDKEKITRAIKTYQYVDVPDFDIIVLFQSDLYKLSPRLSWSMKYYYISKTWDDEKENYNISVNIQGKAYVKRSDSEVELSEKILLEDDIYCVYIKYGDRVIKIPLLDISTSKLSARFQQLLKNKK